MAKKKKNDATFEMVRDTAQSFTIAAAVLAGVLWAITGLFSLTGDSIDTLNSALVLATMVGGVTMGVLYLVKFLKSK